MSIRDEVIAERGWTTLSPAEAKAYVDAVIARLAADGVVVLGPDGEPLDVRPALAGLRGLTARYARQPVGVIARLEWLYQVGITGPLADACLAAAEVEP